LLTPSVNLTTHITDVVNLFKWEGLSDVVLCGHSYGGMVVGGVAEQVRPAIAAIVFLDSFVPQNGDSAGALTSHFTRDLIKAARDKGEFAITPRPAEAFGVNAKDRAWVDRMCTPHPIATFTEKIATTAAVEAIARKIHIRAPSFVNPGFDKAHARAKADPSWRTYEAPCGHDVMVDDPEWLAKILLEA
jgi:pimeloyl-ACP methyl ester carboxylesterase